MPPSQAAISCASEIYTERANGRADSVLDIAPIIDKYIQKPPKSKFRKALCILGIHFYMDWKEHARGEVCNFANDPIGRYVHYIGTCDCCGKHKMDLQERSA
jgi:hypothetical protein